MRVHPETVADLLRCAYCHGFGWKGEYRKRCEYCSGTGRTKPETLDERIDETRHQLATLRAAKRGIS